MSDEVKSDHISIFQRENIKSMVLAVANTMILAEVNTINSCFKVGDSNVILTIKMEETENDES